MLGMNNNAEYWREAAAEARKKNRELVKEIERLNSERRNDEDYCKWLIGEKQFALAEINRLQAELNQARRWSKAWKVAAKHFSMFDDLFGQHPDCDLCEKQP